MPTDTEREPGPSAAGPDEAPDVAPPAPARGAPGRAVVNVARPFFYNAAGERVEISLDDAGVEPGQLDPEALAVLDDEGWSPAAPAADRPAGAPPIAPGAKPLYADSTRQIFLTPNAALRVGAGMGAPPAAPAASPPTPVAPPAPASASTPRELQPLSTDALATLEPLSTDALAGVESLATAPHAAPPPDGDGDRSTARAVEASIAAPVADAAAVPARAPSTPAVVPERVPAPTPGGDVLPSAAPDELARADAAHVEFRSEELDEILSNMPGGLLRWGTTGVFLTVLVFLAVGWFIAYPDVVKGRIVLTTPRPPVRLVALTGGEVARVFAEDGARVRAGEPLVLMKNPANLADVQALGSLLDRLEPALRGSGPLLDVSFAQPPALGTLQTPYAALQQAHADYRLSRDEVFYAQRLAAARAQVADLQAMRERLQAQQTLVEEQAALALRARDRTRELVRLQLGAQAEADRTEEEYLQKRYAVENGRTALTNNEVQLTAQRAALLELEQRRSDEAQRALVTLRNAHQALRAAISAWEQENLLRAPVDGTVTYFRELHANQYVATAEPMVAVAPGGSGLVGRVTLSGNGAGKVEVGQRVIIRLEGYPYREFGTLQGRVERVSHLAYQPDVRVPEAATYLAEVSLPDGLVTSYGRTLELRQEMRGDADVVTQDMRLLERVFARVRARVDGS